MHPAEDPALAQEVAAAEADPSRRIGRYLILDELGRGGFGAVFRAWDPATRRLVALKLVEQLSERRRGRFLREVQVLAGLRHQGIPALHDCGELAGRPWLVMDLVPGRPLDELLDERGAFEPAEAARIVRDLADAVGHAHRANILHRDLKPGNVLHDPGTGRSVLLDFGLARILEEVGLTKTGSLVGTPNFAAPEQLIARTEEIGPASDVYGLGATLYALLTGRPPFEGSSLSDLNSKVQHERPELPRALVPGLDPRLEALVLRCLEKRPADRFPDADALVEALDALRVPLPTPASRRAVPFLAAGAAAVAALGVGLAAIPPASEPPTPPAPTTPAPAASTGGGEGARALEETLRAARRCRWDEVERVARPIEAPLSRWLRARALLALGRDAEAEAELEALARAGGPTAALAGAALALSRGEEDEAAKLAGGVTGGGPEEAEALRLVGLSLATRGERTWAREALERALKLAPDDAAAWTALGWAALRGAGDDAALGTAADAAARALDLSGGVAGEALALRAELHLRRAALEPAAADLQGAVRVAPGATWPQVLLGLLQRERGEPPVAWEELARKRRAAFLAAARLLPVGARLAACDVAGERDLVRRHAGQELSWLLPRAIASLRGRAEAAGPGAQEPLFAALAAAARGEPWTAIEGPLARASGGGEAFLRERVRLTVGRDRHAEAKEALAEARTSLGPDDPELLRLEGEAHVRLNDRVEGPALLERAARSEGADASVAAAQLAWFRRDQGRGLAEADAAVARWPDWSQARLARALSLRGLGRTVEALGEADRALDLEGALNARTAYARGVCLAELLVAEGKAPFEVAVGDLVRILPLTDGAAPRVLLARIALARPEGLECARRATEEARLAQPERGEVYVLVGMIALREGRREATLEAWRRSRELGAEPVPPPFLAEFHQRFGPDPALEELAR